MFDTNSAPKPTLRLIDAIVLIIGIVVGAELHVMESILRG
jgi:APA family basic amino acid/polyamine antiporter